MMANVLLRLKKIILGEEPPAAGSEEMLFSEEACKGVFNRFFRFLLGCKKNI